MHATYTASNSKINVDLSKSFINFHWTGKNNNIIIMKVTSSSKMCSLMITVVSNIMAIYDIHTHCYMIYTSSFVSLGKVKAIGVSNYTVRHLEELLTYATIKPHVLQV